MVNKKISKEHNWIINGIIPLFIIGTLFHFTYNLTGKLWVVGLISPVNESVWEHTKMVVLPIILWWSLYYLVKGKELKINKDKWFLGGLMSLITSIITIPMLFYFYTEAFGVELFWVDVLILLIAIIFGQIMGLHTYKYSRGINSKIVLIIFAVTVIAYMVLTFYPIEIPIFMDGNTKGYGIL